MFKDRLGGPCAGSAGADEADELLTALARPNQADLDEFRRGIDPLAERGKAGRAAGAVSTELQER